MENLDEIQPIDDYVKGLLEYAAKKYNLEIDVDKPTRAQRLEAALAIKDEDAGFSAMEIMVGKRISSDEPAAQNFGFLRIAHACGHSDPEKFYAGFAHLYWPDNKKAANIR